MTCGAEAIIPLKTGFPTLRKNFFTPSNNDGLLEKNLDFIEERRENVMVQLAYYQHKLKQGFDLNVKLRPLMPGDLVLRKVLGTAKEPSIGKVRVQLGRVISYHLGGWNTCILPQRSRRKSCTIPLECKELAKILLLMKFILAMFLLQYALYLSFFLSIKQNIGHAWILGPHTLGKLIL